MVMRSAMAILDRKGIVHIDPNETYIDEILGWALAALGFYFQMKQSRGVLCFLHKRSR